MTKEQALARVRELRDGCDGRDGGLVAQAVTIALEHGNSRQAVAAQLDLDETELVERYPLHVKNAGKVGSLRRYGDPIPIVNLDQD
jgi:hypothetical protein